jgi:ATP-binding cassette subfamily C protein
MVLIRYITEPAGVDISFIDAIKDFAPGGLDQFTLFAIVAGCFFVGKGALGLGFTYLQVRIPLSSGNKLASDLYCLYLQAPYLYHTQKNSAEIIRNIIATVDVVFRNTLIALINCGVELAVVLGLFGVMLFHAPGVTLIVSLTSAVITGIIYLMTRQAMFTYGQRVQNLSKELIKTVSHSLGSIREIRILGKERYFESLFADIRSGLSSALLITMVAQQWPRIILETILFTFIVGLIAVVRIIYGPDLTTKMLPILGLYVYGGIRILPSISRILVGFQVIRYGSAAVSQIAADFNSLGGHKAILMFRRAQPIKTTEFAESIKFEKVSFSYPGHPAPVLKSLDFEARRGESVGIIGKTGAGKSTFLDLLLGLHVPDSGRITVDGADIFQNLPSWWKNIGFVPQGVSIIDDTFRRNVALGIPDDEVDMQRLQDVLRIVRLDNVVARLPEGLDSMLGERGVKLSGGQRQRVAIARALYGDPPILIFDEATSSLDNQTEQEVTDALETLLGKKTMIIVAHRLSTVKNCDKIVIIDGGKIVNSGRYDILMRDCPYMRSIAAVETHLPA